MNNSPPIAIEPPKLSWREKLRMRLAMFYAKRFSLHKELKKHNATATICFRPDSPYGDSIAINVGGMTYYFEGTPEIEKFFPYQSSVEHVNKTLKYGGYEINMMHESNSFLGDKNGN